MIDNMKQQQQQQAPASTASVNVTHTTATQIKTLPTINKTRTGVLIATSMPPPPYENTTPRPTRGGVYVSRVNNIRISQCTKTVRPYVPLKSSRGDDAAVNKRLCLENSIIPTNKLKVSGKSSGGMGQRLSQVPQFVAVRRVSRGFCWPQKITTHPPIWHQPSISAATTTRTTTINIPRFATTLTTSSPQPATAPKGAAPCHSLYPGSEAVASENTKEVVQEHKEQRHMKAINDAFQVLRRALPWVGGRTVAEQRPLGTGSNKINTIKLAVRYIRALEHLLEDGSDDEDMLSNKTTASSQSSSCSPSPSLSRTSLCSVGSDFSDLFSTDSIEDLDALDELMSMSAVNSDALRADSN